MVKRLIGLGLSALAAVGSVVGVRAATPEPRFSVVAKVGDIEIRHYGERIAAETLVSGADEQGRNDGFRRLAGYIFGGNVKRQSLEMTAPVQQAGRSIEMTAPVGQAAEGAAAWRIQFFMPAEFKSIDDLPVPKDSRVQLRVAPAATYAVLVFSGARDGDAMKAKQRELLTRLAATPWRASGEPVNWFYDPPWTLPMWRRNEVAVEVTK